MDKAIKILDDAVKSLEIEIRVWTMEGQFDVVEKCNLELQQVREAIRKLSGGNNTCDEIFEKAAEIDVDNDVDYGQYPL
jgi:hypothetical protein